MPSVASEPTAVLPARPYQPGSRGPAPEAGRSVSPFAELLDSTTASTPEPARPQQSERADSPQAASSKDGTSTQDMADQEETEGKDSEAGARVDESAMTAAGREIGYTKAKSDKSTLADRPNADASATPTSDETAVLDAMFADTAQAAPAVAPTGPAAAQPVAAPINLLNAAEMVLAAAASTADAAEAGPMAALQAAAQPAIAKPMQGEVKLAPGSAKATAAQGDADAGLEIGVSDEPPAKLAAPADPKAPVFEIQPGKSGTPHVDPDNAPGEIRYASADPAIKPDSAMPAQAQGDAETTVKASAEAMQNLGSIAHTNRANTAAPGLAAMAPANPSASAQAAAVPLAGLAVEIVTQARAGKNYFEIRLDPPELGRIDVRLHVDRDGNVSSRLVVDRADTLDLLRRDASGLERALQQAGLKTSDQALEFSLRQQQNFVRDDGPMPNAAQLVVPEDDPAPLEALRQGYGRLLGLGGGLDIRV